MMDRKKVISRLRASYDDARKVLHYSGSEAGALWAQKSAEYFQLKWLVDADEPTSSLHEWNVQGTPFEDFNKSVFWKAVTGCESTPPIEYLYGFVEGAVDLFCEIRDEIEGDTPPDLAVTA